MRLGGVETELLKEALDPMLSLLDLRYSQNGYEARWCGNRVTQGESRPHVIFARSQVMVRESHFHVYITTLSLNIFLCKIQSFVKFIGYQHYEMSYDLKGHKRSLITFAFVQVRIAVFDDGNEGKSLPTGFNADVEGNQNTLEKVDFVHFSKTSVYHIIFSCKKLHK